MPGLNYFARALLLTSIITITITITTVPAYADSSDTVPPSTLSDRFGPGFGATIGASFEVGHSNENSGGDPGGSTIAESIEVLYGYRPSAKWLLGVDLNYRFRQEFSADQSGARDVSAHGYLIGPAAQLILNDRMAVQVAVDVVGFLDLNPPPGMSQNEYLKLPLGIRAKFQYFVSKTLPLSVDLSAGFTSWQLVQVGDVNNAVSTNRFSVGAGISYHWSETQSP